MASRKKRPSSKKLHGSKADVAVPRATHLSAAEVGQLKRYGDIVQQASDSLKMLTAARAMYVGQLQLKYGMSPETEIDLTTGQIHWH